jgi:hypothetical protein
MVSWHLSDFEVISAKQPSESESKSENSFSLLTQSTEASHTPGRHPFGYEDVAVVVETGVVRVDEFAADPLLGIVAHAFHCLGDALDVFAKLNDDFVLFVKQSHARVKFWNKHEVFVSVAISRQTVTPESLEVFAIHIEILQRVMRSIADDYALLAAGTAVNPDAMW